MSINLYENLWGFFKWRELVISCQIFCVGNYCTYLFIFFVFHLLWGRWKKTLSKYKYKNRLEKPYKGEGLENTPDDILLSKQGRSY